MPRTTINICSWLEDPTLIDYYPEMLNNSIMREAEIIISKTVKFSHDDPEDLIIFTCEYFGITEDEFRGSDRSQEFVFARMFFSFFGFEYVANSLSVLGRVMNKNHATVLNGKRKIGLFTLSNTPIRTIYPDFMISHNRRFLCNETKETRRLFEGCTKGKTLRMGDRRICISSPTKPIAQSRFITIQHIYE